MKLTVKPRDQEEYNGMRILRNEQGDEVGYITFDEDANAIVQAVKNTEQVDRLFAGLLRVETKRTRHIHHLREVLREIASTTPYMVENPGAKGWNVHLIANRALKYDGHAAPREHDAEYFNDPDKQWDEFWGPLVTHKDGSIDLDQIKKELSDYSMLLRMVPEVYMHATGGMCSYPNTMPSTVCSLIDDHLSEVGAEDSATRDKLAEALRAVLAATDDPNVTKIATEALNAAGE